MSVFSLRNDLTEQAPPPAHDDFWYTDPETGYTLYESGSSPSSAMRIAAVYRCVAIYAGIVSYLPLNTFEKRSSGKGRDLVDDIPEYSILKKKTNRRQTSNKWRRQIISQILLQGNSYNQIIRKSPRGPVSELLPLDSTRMTVSVIEETQRLKYEYAQPGGSKINLAPENVLHFMGPTLNGITGLTPIGYCRETLQLTKNAEKSAAAFYRNNAQPVGALAHPSKLSKDAHDRMRESWQKVYGGANNAGRVAILEEGTTYTPITMSARDSQYIEIRKFQISEIARLFGVPLPLLGDLDNAHFNNVENLFQIFLTVSLTDMLTMIEQEIDAKLFFGSDYYSKFNVDGLLRGDTEKRSRALEIQARNGVISPNEWREREDYNPREDEDGDLYQRPMNMIYEPFADATEINQQSDPAPAADATKAKTDSQDTEEEDPPPKKPAAPGSKKRLLPVSAFRSIFADAMERIFTKESKRLDSALRKAPDEFNEYVRPWYQKHDETIREILRPVVRGYLDFLRGMEHDVPEGADERFLADFSARAVRSSLSDIEKARAAVRDLQELSIEFYRSRPAEWAEAALTLVNSMVGLPYESEA